MLVDNIDWTVVLFYGSTGVLSVGLHLFWLFYLQHPAGKLLAVAGLVASGGSFVTVLSQVLAEGPDRAALWPMLAWMIFLTTPLLIVSLWMYPVRVRPRSLDALFLYLSAGLWAVQFGTWILARDWLDANSQSPSLIYYTLNVTHSYPSILLGLANAILLTRRAYRVGGRDGRAIALLTGWNVATIADPAFRIVYWTAGGLGANPQFRPAPLAGDVTGDPWGLTTVGSVLIRILAVVFIAYHAGKGNWIPVYLFGAMALVGVANLFVAVDFWGVAAQWGLVAGIYIITKYGAYGARALPRSTAWVLAGSAGFVTYLTLHTGLMTINPESPLVATMSAVVGLVGGAVATWILLPRAARLPFIRGNEADAKTRLDPYHAVLLQEMDSGTPKSQLFEKLRALRVTLGISDHEHAILEYAADRGASPRLTTQRVRPGQRFLNRYRVLRTLGQGGLGVTHLCVDERVQRNVVIKAIRADAGGQSLDALLKEARALGRITHPNVVTLLDADRVGDEVFLVMEHVEGGSLAERIATGPLPPDRWLALANDLLTGLGAVHGNGLVHRDIKPSNILLTESGRAKVADFGVAHIPGFETTVAAGPFAGAVGTVRYMSPEQARGRPPGPASDLYSAGLVLFEAWTGAPYHRVKENETAIELQLRIAKAGAFRGALDAPPELLVWWKQALHPLLETRFQTADDMARSLQKAWPSKPPVAVKRALAASRSTTG